jgi:hypothetical protein
VSFSPSFFEGERTNLGAVRICEPSVDKPWSSTAMRAIAADEGATADEAFVASPSDAASCSSSASSSLAAPGSQSSPRVSLETNGRPPHDASSTICALASVWCTVRKPIFPTSSSSTPSAPFARSSSACALSTCPYSCSIRAASRRHMDANKRVVGSASSDSFAATATAAPKTRAGLFSGAKEESDAAAAPSARRRSVGDRPLSRRWCASTAREHHHAYEGGITLGSERSVSDDPDGSGSIRGSDHRRTRPAPAPAPRRASRAAAARASASVAPVTSACTSASVLVAHRSTSRALASSRYCGRRHFPTRSSPSTAKRASACLFHSDALLSADADLDAAGAAGHAGAFGRSGPVTFTWWNALSAATPTASTRSSCAAGSTPPRAEAAAEAAATLDAIEA